MRHFAIAVSIALLAGCGTDGTSTDEMEEAAIAYARQQLSLPADAAVDATVWAGQEFEGEVVLCGTITGGPEPYRFAGRGDPVDWMIFEPASTAPEATAVDMFPEWDVVCARSDA